MPDTPSTSEFDSYAEDYTEALQRGLSVSGEDQSYFARARLEWLARRLRELGVAPRTVLDYGCGTGGSIPLFFEVLRAETIVGLDVSEGSLAVARRIHAALPVRFVQADRYQAAGDIDLAFCNGVFHHIPPAERTAAAGRVGDALRPGGLFAFWENNPWNPGTRYVMSRIPFDRDAIMLGAREAARLLRSVGFEVIHIDHAFVFPRLFAALRRVEPFLARLPFGAQYQVLCRKPDRAGEPPHIETAHS